MIRRAVALAAVVVALSAGVAGAQFVAPGTTIPVVANLPGEAGTYWRSDVQITNLGDASTQVVLRLYPELVGGDPTFSTMEETVEIEAGEQLTLSNIVQSTFGLINRKGGLQLFSTDGAPLVINSRTFTFGGCGGGSYGQNVYGILVADHAYIGGLRHDAVYRVNLGIFWPWEDSTQMTVTAYNADGSEAGSRTVTFSEAGLQQFSIETLGIEQLLDGYVVISGVADTPFWAYASRVDEATGDAVFQPAMSRQADLPF